LTNHAKIFVVEDETENFDAEAAFIDTSNEILRTAEMLQDTHDMYYATKLVGLCRDLMVEQGMEPAKVLEFIQDTIGT
jgi:hypothetical protein